MKRILGSQARLLLRLFADERGAAAVEYGLLASGVALAITPVVNVLGSKIANTFSSIANSLH